jgi:REP element-mobilizing transposase RayT
MARRPRLLYPGAVYHVMSRGNRKAPVYEDDSDREGFFQTIATGTARYTVVIYAACQMTNHYHLVLSTPRGNLSAFMQYVNGVFAQASNRHHGRTGHVFEARFRSIVVQRVSYLRRASRYVVLNPVRAGMVAEPAAWRWSTYRATAGLEEPPIWLHTRWLRDAFGAESDEEAHAEYRRFVSEPARRATEFDSSGPACGTPTFKRLVLLEALRARPDRLLPLSSRILARPTLHELLGDRTLREVGRDVAMQEAHTVHGYTMTQIGAFLRLDRTTVSKALRRLAASFR